MKFKPQVKFKSIPEWKSFVDKLELWEKQSKPVIFKGVAFNNLAKVK